MTTHERLELRLVRDERGVDGTFGQLYGLATAPLQTGEDDWRDNEPGQSCIPAGTYRCVRTWSPTFKIETFIILGTGRPGRILFHYGNTEEDTKGCVLLGLKRGAMMVPDDEDTPQVDPKRKRAVTSSRIAFDRFMHALKDVDEFTLTVTWMPEIAP